MSEAFWSSWIWPMLTAVLGFAFAVMIFMQWLRRRKPHQAAWAVGMTFYAVAALMEAVSEYEEFWRPGVYRVYIVLAASLVGFLGLGTVYLMVRRRIWGHLYLAFNLVCLIVFAVGVALVKLDTGTLVPGITVGGQALGPSGSFPRFMSLFFNIPGSIFLLGGAVWSAYRFARKKEYAYRMWANVLIAAGTLVIAAAGARARLGTTTGLYFAEMVASALLFAGFILASTLDKGAKAIIRDRLAGRE